MPMLYVNIHVRATCPFLCCMFMSMLHVPVHAVHAVHKIKKTNKSQAKIGLMSINNSQAKELLLL
jgi:hypothetical protein